MKRFGLAVITLALLAACGEKPVEAPSRPISRPFEGQSISVIVPKLDARLIRGPILDEVESFEARTGAKVRVLTPGWNETIEKIDQSLKSPEANFDIYVAISMWSGTLLGGNHIEPVPEAIKTKLDWDDVLPIYRNTVLSWNKVAYGMPYDGDCINLYYRKDLFANPEYQARFKKKYKYDLAPPPPGRNIATSPSSSPAGTGAGTARPTTESPATASSAISRCCSFSPRPPPTPNTPTIRPTTSILRHSSRASTIRASLVRWRSGSTP